MMIPIDGVVHSEWLDKYTLLEVIIENTTDPDKYRFRISWHDENGEYYGAMGDGNFYMTKAEAHAAGILEHRWDSNND